MAVAATKDMASEPTYVYTPAGDGPVLRWPGSHGFTITYSEPTTETLAAILKYKSDLRSAFPDWLAQVEYGAGRQLRLHVFPRQEMTRYLAMASRYGG